MIHEREALFYISNSHIYLGAQTSYLLLWLIDLERPGRLEETGARLWLQVDASEVTMSNKTNRIFSSLYILQTWIKKRLLGKRCTPHYLIFINTHYGTPKGKFDWYR